MSPRLDVDSVAVINRQRTIVIDTGKLQRAVAEVLARCDEAGQEVTVMLVSDRTMRTINRDYRKVDAATDVLSFAMREGPDGDPSGQLLGDLVISLETVRRQWPDSFEDGRPLTGSAQRELALMTIHGVLHLLGYNHDSDAAAAQAMIQRECELFEDTWKFFPIF